MYHRQASVRHKEDQDSIPERSRIVLFLATSSCFLGSRAIVASTYGLAKCGDVPPRPVMLEMDHKVTGLESMDWIHLACDRDQ
jgi:hypothetical protein